MSTHHKLKTHPPYFSAVQSGAKPFEVRSTSDRTFSVWDELELREWIPCEKCHGVGEEKHSFQGIRSSTFTCPLCLGTKGHYTGQSITRRVTYILEGMGIEKGYVCMGLGVVG